MEVVQIINTLVQHSRIAAFMGGLLGGESALILLGFLSAQGTIHYKTAFIFALLGEVSMDCIIFLLARRKDFKIIKKNKKIEKVIEKVKEFIKGKKIITIIFCSKLIQGTRIATLVYLGMQKEKKSQVIGSLIVTHGFFVGILTSLGWLAGKGFFRVVKIQNATSKIVLGITVIGILIISIKKVSEIMMKKATKKTSKEKLIKSNEKEEKINKKSGDEKNEDSREKKENRYEENRREKITAIIPSFNEEERINQVVKEFIKSDVEKIIIVDDGSTDNTENSVIKLCNKSKKVKYIKCEENKGKGQALERGVKESKEDTLFFCDADIRNLKSETINEIIREYRNSRAEMFLILRYTKINKKKKMRKFPFLFLTGVRIIQKELWETIPDFYKKGFRVEMGLNYFAKKKKKRIKFRRYKIAHKVKEAKYGMIKGEKTRWKMNGDIIAAFLRFHCYDRWR